MEKLENHQNKPVILEENPDRVLNIKGTGYIMFFAFILIILLMLFLATSGFDNIYAFALLILFSIFCLIASIDWVTAKGFKIYNSYMFVARHDEGYAAVSIFKKDRIIKFEQIKSVKLINRTHKAGRTQREIVIITDDEKVILSDYFFDKEFFNKMIEILREKKELIIENIHR